MNTGSQREIIITEAFAMEHRRRDRASGLSDGQQGVLENRQGAFEGIFE